MLPDLRQTTLALIREAERISGYPVAVQPDPSLSLPASLAMARGQTAFQTITFNSHEAWVAPVAPAGIWYNLRHEDYKDNG